MKHRILSLLLVMFATIAYAQPVVTTSSIFMCDFNATTQLGCNVSDGTAPYTYQWSQQSWISDPTSPTPTVLPQFTRSYTVTVTDAASLTATASLFVLVKPRPDARILAPDANSICQGSTIKLSTQTYLQEGGPGSPIGPNVMDTIGSGTAVQSGTATQLPYMLSNLVQSHRQQMLFKASEIFSATGSPKVISSLAFYISQLNSNAILQNVEIKIGSTTQDSLTTWATVPLTTVFTAATRTPVNGWNTFNLQVPYYVASQNIVVEICTYNPGLSGNMANKAQYSNTPFRSYVYGAANTNQCGINGTSTASYDRPNMRLICDDHSFNNPTYTYSWDVSGASLQNTTDSFAYSTPGSTANYTVVVTNQWGCADTATYALNANFGNTAPTIDTLIIASPICGLSDGAVTANVTGCSPTYQWSTGGSTNTISSISAGAYTLTVTDCNGCTNLRQAQVLGSGTFTLNTSATNVFCHGQNNGAINLTASGGGSYSYAWSNAFTTEDLANLSAGVYSVTATDNNACTVSASATVNQPTQVAISFNSIVGAACATSNGSACATPSGGTAPYTFAWSNGQLTSCISGVPAGNYTLTVTDPNGCTAVNSVTISSVGSNLAINLDSIVDVRCNGGFTGEIYITPTGGTAPYTYVWSNGTTAQNVSILSAATYYVSVTDANGCAKMDTFIVNEPDSFIVTAVGENNLCSSYGGRIVTTATGGVFPYTYMWTNGLIDASPSHLAEGNYSATVVDMNGCYVIVNATIDTPQYLRIDSIVKNDVSCYGQNDGSACVYVSGGLFAYTYAWGGSGNTSSCLTNLSGGQYYFSVSSDTCTISDTITIFEPAELSVTIANIGDGYLPDTLKANVTGGLPPYFYQWSISQQSDSFLVVNQFGWYGITVVDANFCTDAFTLNVSSLCPDTCVWPGDADYSGTADNTDLLAIGLAYGATGNTRTDQSIAWYAHPSTNWATYLGDTTNYKHIDCNGDGVVNSDDTLAIIQNYNLQHPRSGPDEVRGGIPSLRIRMVPDTLEDGETLIAHLELGDANSTAMNVYGLAFTFNFDALVVDTNEVYIAFDNNSWLCNSATDHIDIDKKDVSAGQIHTALTRIDHTTRSGGGEIGKVSMKITTGNINGKDLANYVMNTYITNLRVIDNLGNVLDVDAIGDEANVQYEPTGINEVNWKGEVSLYPNPAREQLIVTSTQTPINSLQVQNLIGETVWVQQNLATTKVAVNTATLAEGVYVLQLGAGNRVYHAKFIVVK